MVFDKLIRRLKLLVVEKNVSAVTDEDEEYIKWCVKQHDTKYEHLCGYLWYPKNISWELKERTPRKNPPVFALVGNWRTKKMYIASDEVVNMMREEKIEWVTSTWKSQEDAVTWIKSLEFINRVCTAEDLK